MQVNPWVRKIPWRRKWQPTPVFLPEKSHEQMSLACFSSMWIKNFQTYKLGLEKAEEAKIIANIRWITEKARELQKNVSFCFIDYTKAFVWITTNCGKFFKRWEYQTTLPVSWETYMQVKKQQLETYMGQLTGSKLGKEYNKTVYCHPIYLTYMQSTSCKILHWMNHKLETRLLGEISTSSGMKMIPKWRGTKEPLDEGERGEWKSWLKLNIQKKKPQHSKT